MYLRDLNTKDVLALLGLVLWTSVLNLYGLSALEFIRHTEADRSLIAWEMYEGGSLLVPKLLSSVILTKPPMFYWSLAFSFTVFDEVSVWTARFPSVVASLLFVILQYLAVRAVGMSRDWACLSGLILSSSLSFYTLAPLAEIDMLYGFLSAGALYGIFFLNVSPSKGCALLSYFLLALSFLTKGPPTFIFFIATVCLLLFSHLVFKTSTKEYLWRFFFAHITGLGLFMLILGVWLVLLATEVTWMGLWEQLRVEVIDRALYPSKRDRGYLFYIGAFCAALVPWTPLVFLGGGLGCLKLWRKEKRYSFSANGFFEFNVLLVCSAIVLLSLASGKSSRYLFPIHAFSVNLATFAIFSLRDAKILPKLFRGGYLLTSLCAVVALGIPLVLSFEGVSRGFIVLCSLVLSLGFFLISRSSLKERKRLALIACASIMFCLRFGQTHVYASHRNTVRSVKPVAEEIHSLLPVGVPLYTLELFERWVCFYLKQQGRESIRLTPALVERRNESDTYYFLLNKEEESWRLEHLQQHAVEYRLLKTLVAGKHTFLLLEFPAAALTLFKPRAVFPTTPTIPSQINVGFKSS